MFDYRQSQGYEQPVHIMTVPSKQDTLKKCARCDVQDFLLPFQNFEFKKLKETDHRFTFLFESHMEEKCYLKALDLFDAMLDPKSVPPKDTIFQIWSQLLWNTEDINIATQAYVVLKKSLQTYKLISMKPLKKDSGGIWNILEKIFTEYKSKIIQAEWALEVLNDFIEYDLMYHTYLYKTILANILSYGSTFPQFTSRHYDEFTTPFTQEEELISEGFLHQIQRFLNFTFICGVEKNMFCRMDFFFNMTGTKFANLPSYENKNYFLMTTISNSLKFWIIDYYFTFYKYDKELSRVPEEYKKLSNDKMISSLKIFFIIMTISYFKSIEKVNKSEFQYLIENQARLFKRLEKEIQSCFKNHKDYYRMANKILACFKDEFQEFVPEFNNAEIVIEIE
ncbi:hypothetical protein ROZALSC1DRAFT_27829 [Rozella allomycis CSF55]|uniref:Uncharacterized protein n=1 Tax=Rozella allomycis (strain CSF55) TaxID=988480 RepID=A0A075ATK8_ROZAC|nr:hypothetical protein O9G_000366 [Rozella allomycis CSF55]RKP20715.1 hypothetical protein ROZALSC1DRAFT_27829 [Rozella allomycis CSF55]|eukprot:EPZ33591.1 hypothetical protein O9G_000366 [Rozella allomycis CSF55]